MLRLFGARIGRGVRIHPGAVIAIPWNLEASDYVSIGDGVRLYNLGLVQLGPGVTISQGGHLCAGTHDYTQVDLPLVKAPIRVLEGAWVCADAFVGPGVTIGDYSIVGARGVVMRDVPPWTVVAGNPARRLRARAPLSKP